MKISILEENGQMKSTYFERILARETLVAVIAREGLYSKVNPLMSLQVMVSVEALRALVAFERPIMRWWLLRRICSLLAIHALWVCGIATVEAHWQHVCLHVAHHSHLAPGTVHV